MLLGLRGRRPLTISTESMRQPFQPIGRLAHTLRLSKEEAPINGHGPCPGGHQSQTRGADLATRGLMPMSVVSCSAYRKSCASDDPCPPVHENDRGHRRRSLWPLGRGAPPAAGPPYAPAPPPHGVLPHDP